MAINYVHLAYEKATKINHVDDRLECLDLLIQNSPENKSKKYSMLYLKINDSIIKVRQKAKNQFAKIKYDSTKEKEENIKLKAQTLLQKEQQKNKNVLMYFVVGIIILISILIFHFLVAKNKREKIKTSYNTEIRIAKKLTMNWLMMYIIPWLLLKHRIYPPIRIKKYYLTIWIQFIPEPEIFPKKIVL